MSKTKIGFIGLGAMGAAMVECLQRAGYELTVLANRSRAAVDVAIKRGAGEVNNAREIAECCDVIMLCVDTSASVEARMQGDDGIISGLSAGKIVIDFGTSLPDSTRRLGVAVAARGAVFLDAPLGRTPAHARQGKLNVMASGDKDAFEKVRPVLEVIGENVFYFGALGTGNTIKLINNFFGMTTASAMAEAFAMAEAAGVPAKQLHEVMAAGPLHSDMMDFIKAYAVDGDRDGIEFSIRNAHKDVGYYAAMATAMGVPSLMSGGANQALGLAANSGFGGRNVGEMVDFYRGFVGGKNK